jgi:hypothetical protein
MRMIDPLLKRQISHGYSVNVNVANAAG